MAGRVIVFLLLASLSSGEALASGGSGVRSPTALRIDEVLAQNRGDDDSIIVTTIDGQVVAGNLIQVDKAHCYLREDLSDNVRLVKYSNLRSIQIKGISYQVRRQTGKISGRRPSAKVWLWIGVAIGVVVVLIYATGLNRA